MIHDVEEFVNFLDGLRKRTNQYVQVVPNTLLEWKPAENKFSIGELIRHLGSSQLMFLSVLKEGNWTYTGHDSSKGEDIEEISRYLETCHATLREGLLTLGNELLTRKVQTLHGHEVSSWRILMALAEHEIHHRGQLSTYLQINDIQPPQIFGLKIEQVKEV